jgi:hypothetical protein
MRLRDHAVQEGEPHGDGHEGEEDEEEGDKRPGWVTVVVVHLVAVAHPEFGEEVPDDDAGHQRQSVPSHAQLVAHVSAWAGSLNDEETHDRRDDTRTDSDRHDDDDDLAGGTHTG